MANENHVLTGTFNACVKGVALQRHVVPWNTVVLKLPSQDIRTATDLPAAVRYGGPGPQRLCSCKTT